MDKFIGDCVMALWGAVDQRDDAARMAITAALEIVQRASGIMVSGRPLEVESASTLGRQWWSHRFGSPTGLHGHRRDGEPAARLCAVAQASEVLVTGATLMRAGSGVSHEANEARDVEGHGRAPIVPYSVRALSSKFQPSQAMSPHGQARSRSPNRPSPQATVNEVSRSSSSPG